MENLEQAFGKPAFAGGSDNPLYGATDLQQEAYESEMSRMYQHRKELRRHCDSDEPF